MSGVVHKSMRRPLKAAETGAPSSLFEARNQIKSTHTSELVIALCGPIGSPLHNVAQAIKNRLERDFAYDRCEVMRLSTIIEKHTSAADASSKFARTKDLISKGDKLREDYGPSVLAELAVSEIALDRQRAKSSEESDRYVSRRVCHMIDSIKNQAELDILRLLYGDMLYFVGVFSPLPARIRSMQQSGMSLPEIHELIDQDSGEEFSHGQTVRETFHQSDFFLRVDADTDTQISSRVERFLHLILGTKVLTPTYHETAMYVAASAAGNSACLSRQVGAALTDRDGHVLATGWNDVPKFDGGLYSFDAKKDVNGEHDKRCWNLDGGKCFNDEEKGVMAELIIGELIKIDLINGSQKSAAVNAVKKSKLRDLIEFSRAVHAEVHAILTAGRQAGDKVQGGKVFCTTYPCHSCARHMVAASIHEVYYIEPYRKSLATKLHHDSISEDEKDIAKLRILPYDGVAPRRYLRLFCVPVDARKDGGRLRRTDPRTAEPRFDKTLEALPALEALVVKGLAEKKLVSADVAK